MKPSSQHASNKSNVDYDCMRTACFLFARNWTEELARIRSQWLWYTLWSIAETLAPLDRIDRPAEWLEVSRTWGDGLIPTNTHETEHICTTSYLIMKMMTRILPEVQLLPCAYGWFIVIRLLPVNQSLLSWSCKLGGELSLLEELNRNGDNRQHLTRESLNPNETPVWLLHPGGTCCDCRV